MKYMGSKRAMLQNGLGELLDREAASARRFFDLFAGSGVVAIHVAQQFAIPVHAIDLQLYSNVLTEAVLLRSRPFEAPTIWKAWESKAQRRFLKHMVPSSEGITKTVIYALRQWCDEQGSLPITKAYGGHYFSPAQAVWIDALRASLPRIEPVRTAALAALIRAASQCAAAPGHTAQPFQPTRGAKPFLVEAWSRDILGRTKAAFESIAAVFAIVPGSSEIADANEAACQLREGDVAFIDPPYSGVQYSRFYHVLETIASGNPGNVSGVGRYPPPEARPHSSYCLITESKETLNRLLKTIADRGARAVLTFPDHQCSNGLSGSSVRDIAEGHFRIERASVKSQFSTLGGKGANGIDEAGRLPRHHTKELMLVLSPR